MSTQVQASPVQFRERRRSERLPFRDTVIVCGRCQGQAFKEETLTVSVSASGALLSLAAKVSVGQRLLLMNPQTWDEQEAYVARLGEAPDGRWHVGIQFAAPAPQFWPLRSQGPCDGNACS